MRTKITNSSVKERSKSKIEHRDDITFTVFAIFFVIALGLLMLSQV